MKILLVEDDLDIREAVVDLLSSKKYTVHSVKDGFMAFEYLRGHLLDIEPDVIMFDLAMPNMNGFEFREQQLRDADLCDIPVIVLSAMHFEQWIRDKLGADYYIQKPIDSKKLLAALDEIEHGPKNAPAPNMSIGNRGYQPL